MNTGFAIEVPPAKIAFFDLDETVTDADTDVLWGRWRPRSPRGLIEGVWLRKLYRDFRRGGLDIEELLKFMRFRVGPLTAEEFRARGRDFFENAGKGHVHGEAAALIAALKRKGCRVVLLTSQHDCISGPFAEYIGMDDMIAVRFEVAEGRFTRPVRPCSFGEGKVLLGRQYAERAGVSLSDCAYYGDSIYDAFFMSLVGHPYAVNPDRLLERRAGEENWKILRFGAAER